MEDLGIFSAVGHVNHWITVFLIMAGLYIIVARSNMIKKLVGLSIFQTSVYLLYISPGKIISGTAPICRRLGHLLQPPAARSDSHPPLW